MEPITQESQADAVRQAEIRGMRRTLALSIVIAVVLLSIVLLSYVL